MSYPIVTEAFAFVIHVMAGRNDYFPDNYTKYGVHGLLCDNANDVQAASLGTQRFVILPTGAFAAFENNELAYTDVTYQDYAIGPVAKATFGRPSSDEITTGVIGYDDYGNEIIGEIHSEGVSNLDFSASDPYTVAFTSDYYGTFAYANHSAGLSYNWLNFQGGPMPGGSTTKSVSLNYTAYAGPVSYSGTRSFSLLDYQYYDTVYPPNQDWSFVYVDMNPVPIANAGSGRKPDTTFTSTKVTSGQFNHTAAQFFEYA